MGQNWPQVTFYAHQKNSKDIKNGWTSQWKQTGLLHLASSTIIILTHDNLWHHFSEFPVWKNASPCLCLCHASWAEHSQSKNRMKIGHDDESIAFLDFKGYSEPAISRMPKTFFRLTTMPPPWWRQPEPKRNSAWRAACVFVPYHTTKWQWQKSKFASTRRPSNCLSYCLQIWSWRQDRAKKWDYIPRSYLLSSE